MRQGRRTKRTDNAGTARGFAFAAALALLAVLGVASGLWPVAHQNVDHVAAAQQHEDEHHGEPAPHSDEAPRPLDEDCSTCDLIAGSQIFTLTQVPAGPGAAAPIGPPRAIDCTHPFREVDLTSWSARPPPRLG